MCGKWEDHAKCKRLAPAFATHGDELGKGFGRLQRTLRRTAGLCGHFQKELIRERDRIAVEIEREGRDERHADVSEAQACGDGKRRQHMRRVEMTEDELV